MVRFVRNKAAVLSGAVTGISALALPVVARAQDPVTVTDALGVQAAGEAMGATLATAGGAIIVIGLGFLLGYKVYRMVRRFVG